MPSQWEVMAVVDGWSHCGFAAAFPFGMFRFLSIGFSIDPRPFLSYHIHLFQFFNCSPLCLMHLATISFSLSFSFYVSLSVALCLSFSGSVLLSLPQSASFLLSLSICLFSPVFLCLSLPLSLYLSLSVSLGVSLCIFCLFLSVSSMFLQFCLCFYQSVLSAFRCLLYPLQGYISRSPCLFVCLSFSTSLSLFPCILSTCL